MGTRKSKEKFDMKMSEKTKLFKNHYFNMQDQNQRQKWNYHHRQLREKRFNNERVQFSLGNTTYY